jgi:hypothetical protein
VAAERIIFSPYGSRTSYSELMALPNRQLDTTYWLPWYNNVDMDSALRFGNVSGLPATVHVYIGGTEMDGSPFSLGVGESMRISFPGVNSGVVQITSDQPIVAAERIIFSPYGSRTSYSELMALPDRQLSSTYWLPWYDNVGTDTALRFGNVSSWIANVHVYIGGVEMPGSPFSLGIGASTRISFTGVKNGPVTIISDRPIVAAQRVIYSVKGARTSYSEMLGLPNTQLATAYWLPWYNDVDMDTLLRASRP